MGGDIFALMLVGSGHQKAVEVLCRQPFAQPGDTLLAERAIAFRIKGLEHVGRAFCFWN